MTTKAKINLSVDSDVWEAVRAKFDNVSSLVNDYFIEIIREKNGQKSENLMILKKKREILLPKFNDLKTEMQKLNNEISELENQRKDKELKDLEKKAEEEKEFCPNCEFEIKNYDKTVTLEDGSKIHNHCLTNDFIRGGKKNVTESSLSR